MDANNAQLVDAVVEAYHDWQGFLEGGYGDDFDAVAKQKQQEWERLRAELLSRMGGDGQ